MSAVRDERLPVTIVTGYLGSGKTTLLNRVLRERALARTAVVVNEVGAIGLDHLLIAAPEENLITLASGCLCCSVRGELVTTLSDLWRRREGGELPPFERVLIETTGLADPVPVLQTLVADDQVGPRYRLDGVVTLVDGVHGAAQLDAHREALKQVALADRLLLTKCDLAPAAALDALEARLAAINPGARRLRVRRGRVAARELIGLGARDQRATLLSRWLRHLAYARAAERGAAWHESGIDAFALFVERPVTEAGLAAWLHLLGSLRGANLLRMKGLLNVAGRPVAVHAVQSLIEEPIALARWPDAERRSRLVFITRGIERAAIERTLGALAYDPGTLAQGFDARAYERFLAVAGNFR